MRIRLRVKGKKKYYYLEHSYREGNKIIKKEFDKRYQASAKKQLEVGERSKDIGSGGGIPGQKSAPRTMKEAKEAAISYYKSIGK